MRKHVWLSALLAMSIAAFGCGDDGGTDTDAGIDAGDTPMDGGDTDGGGDTDAGEEVNPLIAAIAADSDLDQLEALMNKLASTNGPDGEPILDITLLDSLSQVTVFAPVNDAFTAAYAALGIADLDSATTEQLLSLYGIFLYHVSPAEHRAADIEAAEPLAIRSAVVRSVNDLLTGFGGVPYFFDTSGEGIAIQYQAPTAEGPMVAANVTMADIDVLDADSVAIEGMVIHKIDGVLVPPNVAALAELAGFTGLTDAAKAAMIDPDGEGGMDPISVYTALRDPSATYTVFAPSNDGMAGFLTAVGIDLEAVTAEQMPVLAGVLTNHVLVEEVRQIDFAARYDALNTFTMFIADLDGTTVINGGSAAMTGANLLDGGDILAANGIIHFTDVPFPPLNAVQMSAALGLTGLLGNVMAADAAAMGDDPIISMAAANSMAPVTLFAPTNEAFTTSAASGVLNGADAAAIRDVLLYHTGASPMPTAVLETMDTMSLTTLGASGATVNVADGAITFTDAQGNTITPVEGMTDIITTSGVIHVVDAVMDPTE